MSAQTLLPPVAQFDDPCGSFARLVSCDPSSAISAAYLKGNINILSYYLKFLFHI
jgi:hypothetical protein